MDVLLVQLPDRAALSSSTLRCARVGVERRTVGTVVTLSGAKVGYSEELICRVASAPAVGESITVAGVTGTVSARRIVDTLGPWQRHARVYVTQRSDITGPLPVTVTVYPSTTTTDAYGTTIRKPSTSGLTMAGRIDPGSTTENHGDGQRRDQSPTLTVDGDLAGLGVDAYSTVHAAGVVYQVVGDPVVRPDGIGGYWTTATLRRTGPGTA